MNNYSAQGSITVKRLRSGDSLFITIENNGKPLYQGVDSESGSISPDWSIEQNQPVLTPKVTSSRRLAVTLSNHKWNYNGADLVFNGEPEAEGWITDTTGKFQLNTNGSLKIIQNLASKINIANDILTYTCIATVSGIEYTLTKSVDVIIQPVGASSYYGTIMATTEQLTAEETTTTVSTKLYLGAAEVPEYHVKWYKDNTLWPEKSGKQITITREDVNGTQLFIAEFYKQSSDSTPIFRAGLRIIDSLDQFIVVCSITSVNKQVDIDKPVTVVSKVINVRTNSVVSPAEANWRSDIMDKKTWAVLKTANADTIEVTTVETDRDGEENDVEVVAEVEWK